MTLVYQRHPLQPLFSNEALDLSTATGRAMPGLLAIFTDFEREILHEVITLFKSGLSESEIARRLDIRRTSVRKLLLHIQDETTLILRRISRAFLHLKQLCY